MQEVCLKGLTQLLHYLLVAIASCKQNCSPTILREGCKNSILWSGCLYGSNKEVTSKEAHNGIVLIAHNKMGRGNYVLCNTGTHTHSKWKRNNQEPGKQSQAVVFVVNIYIIVIDWLGYRVAVNSSMQIYASIVRLLPCYPHTCPLWLHIAQTASSSSGLEVPHIVSEIDLHMGVYYNVRRLSREVHLLSLLL